MNDCDPPTTQALAKFGPEKYMEALFKRGVVLMNRLEYFVGLESDRLRGDRNEALTGYWSHERAKVTIGGLELPLAGPLRVWENRDRHRAAYCLYGVSDLRAPIDSRCRAFGDTVVFFKDGQEFVRRVFGAAEALGHALALQPVRYVSHLYCGPMDPFTKLSDFSYQNEWRMVTRDPTAGPLLLEVGSLEDIALRVRFDDLRVRAA